MSGYEYDIFLSYSRRGTSGAWVRNHLAKTLKDCLDDERGTSAVFVDEQVETGTVWPAHLEKVLNRSKLMVSVLSPPYFESAWCMTEIETMRRREELIGMATTVNTSGIILPLVYSDGACFPEWVTTRQALSFKEWNYPHQQFDQTPIYLSFFAAVRQLAGELAAQLERVPEWTDGWPIERDPVVSGPRRAALPEL
ncbi:MAG: toll/interleukin-1 receptor domain-containing protein [Actinoplanes sp.]